MFEAKFNEIIKIEYRGGGCTPNLDQANRLINFLLNCLDEFLKLNRKASLCGHNNLTSKQYTFSSKNLTEHSHFTKIVTHKLSAKKIRLGQNRYDSSYHQAKIKNFTEYSN